MLSTESVAKVDHKSKVYVRVDVAFDEDGNMRPSALTWEDGTRYEIDRIIDRQAAAAQKAGGCGDRYTIRVGGKETYLFFEHSPSPYTSRPGRWFVERR